MTIHRMVVGLDSPLCASCGRPATDLLHALPPVKTKPVLKAFEVGDQVTLVADELVMDFDAGDRGEVASLAPDYDVQGKQVAVWVRFDKAPRPERVLILIRNLRKLVKPPTFSSVEEAEAWLDAQEAQS